MIVLARKPAAGPGRRHQIAASRMRADLEELARPGQTFRTNHASVDVALPDASNVMVLDVRVSLHQGAWGGLEPVFRLSAPDGYPFSPPRVTALTPLWHPNVEADTGRLQIPLLHRDWKPVVTVNTVIFALQLMFAEPSLEGPVANPSAADAFRSLTSTSGERRKRGRGGEEDSDGLLYGAAVKRSCAGHDLRPTPMVGRVSPVGFLLPAVSSMAVTGCEVLAPGVSLPPAPCAPLGVVSPPAPFEMDPLAAVPMPPRRRASSYYPY